MATKADKIKHDLPDSHEVEIEHPKTGERYGVTMGAFREHYDKAGFKVDRHGDGTPIVADAKAPESTPEIVPVGPQGPEPEVPEGGVIPVPSAEIANAD